MPNPGSPLSPLPPGVTSGVFQMLMGIFRARMSGISARLRNVLRMRPPRPQGVQRQTARADPEPDLPFLQAYFANIVELSEDAIISIDVLHRIRLFNQGAEAIFGYRAAEMIDRPLDLLLPPGFSESHRAHVTRFAASGDALRPMNERGAIVGVRKDGTEFPAEATISKFTVKGETVLSVRLRDITQRKQAEAGLQRLAALVESSDDAIIGQALDGTIVTWNAGAERLYGYAASEVVGRPFALLVQPDGHAELSQLLERVRRGRLRRELRDGGVDQGRHRGRGFSQHLPHQGRRRHHHRHVGHRARHHPAEAPRGPASPGPEDGGHRHPGRRHRARL